MNSIRKRTVVAGVAVAIAAVTAIGSTAASACRPKNVWDGEFEYGALYADGATDLELFVWADAEAVPDGQGDTVKQEYSIYEILKKAKACPNASSQGVGPSSAAAFDGELALYTWGPAGAIYRTDQDATATYLGKGDVTKVAGRTVPCIRWGGDVNPVNGEILQTGDYTNYVNDKGGNATYVVLIPGENSATVQAVSSPKMLSSGDTLTTLEKAATGKKIATWYIGSDLAYASDGTAYQVFSGSAGVTGARWLVSIDIPRLADGNVDPTGIWTYTPILRLGDFPKISGCLGVLDLWGLAYIGDHIYMGYAGGNIYRADVNTGDVAFFGKGECGLQDLATGNAEPFPPDVDIQAWMDPDFPYYVVEAYFTKPTDGSPVKGVKCSWDYQTPENLTVTYASAKSDEAGLCYTTITMDLPGTYNVYLDWKRGPYADTAISSIGQGTPPRT